MAGVIKERKFRAMGTEILLMISADQGQTSQAERDLADLEKKYIHWEEIFSRFDPQSELSYFNRHLKNNSKASEEMLNVAREILECHYHSEKYFDPRIISQLENSGYQVDFKKNKFDSVAEKSFQKISGDLAKDLIIRSDRLEFRKRMDFSGLVKGWATDESVKLLDQKGWKNFLIDSGGDIMARGKNEKGQDWLVGIEGINEEKLKLKISNRAVATSGITRRKWELAGKRYHHLVNPLNPESYDFNLKSVTVVNVSAQAADIEAKTLFLMGSEQGIARSEKNLIASLFIDQSGLAIYSKTMKQFLKS